MGSCKYLKGRNEEGREKVIEDLVEEMIELGGIEMKYIGGWMVEKFGMRKDGKERLDEGLEMEG